MNSINKILVFNMTRMGDLVQSTPLISGLRHKHPEARISLIITRDFYEFSERIPNINERIVFDLKQFKENRETTWVELYRYLEKFLETLKERNFDLVINLSHSKLSALMIQYLGLKNVRGFLCNSEGERMTYHPWLQYFFIEPFNRDYNSFNLVDIFSRGGDVEPGPKGIEIIEKNEDLHNVKKWFQNIENSGKPLIVGIQAGSSLEGRRWPTEYFAKLANKLIQELGVFIILFGVNSESKVANEIYSQINSTHQVLDLTGKTNYSELIGALKHCQYLITNDTGTMHIAAALSVRIIGLFFAHAHPYETAPYKEENIIFQARIPCAPCSYGVTCHDVVCVHKVQPDLVFSMLENQWKNGEWEYPDQVIPLKEVQIFKTSFDSENYLKLKPLIRYPITIKEIFTEVYRLIWKIRLAKTEELNCQEGFKEVSRNLKDEFEIVNIPLIIQSIKDKCKIVEKLIGLGHSGVEHATRVIRFFPSNALNKGKLGKSVSMISKIDDEISLIGMTCPEVKPICDMFNKRKENFLGDDVLKLAELTKDVYLEFLEELTLLKKLLTFLIQDFLEKERKLSYVETNSSKVAVPGK